MRFHCILNSPDRELPYPLEHLIENREIQEAYGLEFQVGLLLMIMILLLITMCRLPPTN